MIEEWHKNNDHKIPARCGSYTTELNISPVMTQNLPITTNHILAYFDGWNIAL
jgi:hypothetical protein